MISRSKTLELPKRKQDVQGQSAQRGGGIQLLGHGHKAHRPLIEPVHEPGEIQ